MSNWQTALVFARLRWRTIGATFKRGGQAAAMEIVATIIMLVVGLFAGVGAFFGLRAASPGTTLTAALIGGCSLLVFATTGFAVVVGVNNSLDLRVIATEPLTRFQRAVGQLTMAVVGPTGVAMLLLGIGTLGGIVGSLSSFPLAAAAILSLLVFNMLAARVIINTLAVVVTRWPRVGQYVAAMAGLAVMVSYQIGANTLPRMSSGRLVSIARALQWLPGGSIGRSLGGAAAGGFGSAGAWLGVLWTAAWIPCLVWLFAASSERLNTTVASGQQRAVRNRVAWSRLFGGGLAGAISARTMLTTVRSPRRMVELIMGSAVGAASVVVPPLLAVYGADEISESNGVAGVTMITGFGVCFAVILSMSNMFGSDGPGISHEFLAGVGMRDVLTGKRRCAVAVGLPVAIIGTLAVAVFTDAWTTLPISAAVTLAGVFGGSGVALALSSWAPWAVPEDTNPFALNSGSSGILPVLMWFVSIGVLVVAMAPLLLGIAFASAFDSMVVAGVLAVLAVAWAYGLSRLAELVSLRRLDGHEARLIEQVTRA